MRGLPRPTPNRVRIFNTVVRGCGQGIEAGYGSPRVLVDHCVVVENEVGLRFGDSYDRGSQGRMLVSNSIVYNNVDNVLNYDLKTGQPVPGGITISYSLVEDSELDSSATVWSETPIFDDDYSLLPSSPGKGQGIDGTDIGLIDPLGPLTLHADPDAGSPDSRALEQGAAAVLLQSWRAPCWPWPPTIRRRPRRAGSRTTT